MNRRPISRHDLCLRTLVPTMLVLALLLGASPGLATTRTVPNPYATIQDAVTASVPGDTILVSPGTYEGTGNYNVIIDRRNLTIRAPGGRDFTTIRPTTSADCSGSTNRRAFIVAEGGFTLEGFTIRNGCAQASGFGISSRGGGITFDFTPDPVGPLAASRIRNCRFVDCGAGSYGGAAYVFDSHSVEFESCVFESNYAPEEGGAVYVGPFAAPETRFTGCDFSGNIAVNDGGAVAVQGRIVRMTSCVLETNRSNTKWGGALAAFRYVDTDVAGEIQLTDCLLHSNTANGQADGAAIRLAANCVLTGNHVTIAGNSPHGLTVGPNGQVDMTNTIVYFNTGDEIIGLPDNTSLAGTRFTYSDVRAPGTAPGGTPWPAGGIGQGDHNINLDPLFCNAASDDYQLDPSSPCTAAAGNGLGGTHIGVTNVTCGTPPVCTPTVAATDFGQVALGGTAQLSFTIQNTGGGTLSGSVTESCPDYSVAGNPSYSLTSGQSRVFVVSFTPSSPGDQSCPVNLGSSCGTIAFTGTTPPVCGVVATTTAFGAVAIGDSRTLPFTLRNDGGSVLTGTVTESCAEFEITGEASYVLAGGESQDFTVRFAPLSEGNQTCVVNLGSSCGTLSFTGTTPPVCDVSAATTDFGEVTLGGNGTLPFTITNVGGGVLSGTVTESCPDFTIQGGATYSLSAGQSQVFSLQFAPAFPGPQTCVVNLGSTCGTLSFSGTTPPASCTVTVPETNFGPVAIDSTATLTVELTNPGTQDLSGMLTESCGDFTILGDPTYALASTESAVFTIEFAPTVVGDQSCAIDLGSSCGGVVLAGTTPAVCTETHTTLDFGQVFVGNSKSLTFTLKNTGGDVLAGTVAESCADFTVLDDPTYTLAAGESRVFTIEFAPSVTGPQTCVVDLGSSCGSLTFSGATPPPVCLVTAVNTNFGEVAVDGSSSLQFTIKNDGGGSLQGTVTETCPDFEILEPPTYALGPAQTKSFTLRFAPQAPGNQSCVVDLGSTCGTLTFTGTTPVLCAVMAAVTDFGEVFIGSTSTLAFSVRNDGGSILSGSIVESCSDFSLLGNTSYALGPGQSQSFMVQFAPSSPGPQTCVVDVGSACGTVSFQGRTPSANCTVSAAVTDFGPVTVNTSKTLSFSIKNSGGSVLTGTVGESCLAFALPGDPTYSLFAGETKSFDLTFTPTVVGDQTCTVDLGSSCGSLSFTGTTPAVCQVDVPVTDFGEVFIGSVAQLPIGISNAGGSLLVGTVVEGCSAFSILGGGSYSLAQGESTVVTLQFAPVVPGEQSCIVNLGLSCGGAQTFTGRTPPPVCAVVATETDFGEVAVGSSGSLSFSIQNTGGGLLTGTVSESCPDFSFSGSATYSLGAGQLKTFQLSWNPMSEGDQSCTVDLDSTCGPLSFTGTTPAQCLASAPATDFGAVSIGSAGTLPFSVTNGGGGTLSGTVSASCSDFVVLGDASYELSAGGTKQFTLQFSPSFPGDQACDVALGSSCGSVQFVGTTPPADCAVSAPTTAFGPVPVGNPATLTFTIQNSGGSILAGTVSENCADFRIVESPEYSLGAGEIVPFTLEFTPSAAGDQTCVVSFGAESCGSLGFTGTTPAICTVTVPETDFGAVDLGQFAELPVTIRNSGGSVLTGTFAETCPDFAIQGSASYNIPSNGEITRQFRFAPTFAGPRTCTLTLGGSCGAVEFQGTTPPPICAVVAPNTNFGAVPVEQTGTRVVTVVNEGGSILSGTVSESCADFAVLGDPTYSLRADESKNFTIAFHPTVAGDQSCTLDLGGSCGPLTMVGSTPPACQVAAITDFGEVPLGSAGLLSFDLTNGGGGVMIGLVSELCIDFSIVGDASYSLAQGESKSFTVRFAPSFPSPQTCNVSLGSNCGSLVFSGRTPPSKCSVTPSTTDFQAVRIGETATLSFTLENSGGGRLDGRLTVVCPFDFSIPGDRSYDLGAGESKTFFVQFAPTSSAPQTCTVSLDSPCGELTFQGRGVDIPTVTFPMPLEPVPFGSAVPVVARLQDDGSIVSATLFYQRGGERPVCEAPMSVSPNGGGFWDGTIPGDMVTEDGVRYYVVAVDDEGFSSEPGGWTNVDIGVERFPAATVPDSQYLLGGISFEAQLGGSPTSVFRPQFGDYDTTRWRYGTHDGAGYLDGDAAAPPTPGQGFWIYSKAGGLVRSDGLVTNIAQAFTIDLHPGWNQIANPYQFAIESDAVTIADTTCVARDFIDWDRAARAYRYDRALLEPGVGYWIFNGCAETQSVVLPVEPPEGDRGRVADRAPWDLAPRERGWSVEIVATSDGMRDGTNWFGMRERGTDARDAFDFADAPDTPGDHLGLSFVSDAAERLHVDHRAVSDDGAYWVVALRSSQVGRSFELALDGLDALPPDWEVVAIEDTPLARSVSVRESRRITGTLGPANVERRWRLVVGTARYVEETARRLGAEFATQLGQFAFAVGPNPFRGASGTVFALTVPASAHGRVDVYNVQGRRVSTLFDGPLEPGIHRVSWNGVNAQGAHVAPGIYFARMKADDFEAVRKVVLLR